jgi:DNA processing protein
VGDRTVERARERHMNIAFPGDPAYPHQMVGMRDAPAVLFWVGALGAPRRRVAMVGSRHPEQGFLERAQRLARRVAERGVCIVSGAAEGIDRACHQGALEAGASTWAFVGSALDQLDSAQAALLPSVLAGGGMFFSELPPGVRATKQTFPRRNRLVSGASDVVVVLRAGQKSGCVHTVAAALQQGRDILVVPGDPELPSAAFSNALIQDGLARVCLRAEDVWNALGVQADEVAAEGPREEVAVDWERLSGQARVAYDALSSERAVEFDDVLAHSQLEAATLTSALCELELVGLVVQKPGKRYERV